MSSAAASLAESFLESTSSAPVSSVVVNRWKKWPYPHPNAMKRGQNRGHHLDFPSIFHARSLLAATGSHIR